MSAHTTPDLPAFFDLAIEKIRAHASYGPKMERAAREQRELVLNFHTHGPGQGYCASICTLEGALPMIGLAGELVELVHLRGIAQRVEQCDPMMDAFADRLMASYRLNQRPITWIDGKPKPA